MPLGTLDKGLGCSLRPTSEPELDLGTCPSSNYVERETKQGEPKSGFKCLEEPQLQAGPAGPADRTAPRSPPPSSDRLPPQPFTGRWARLGPDRESRIHRQPLDRRFQIWAVGHRWR